MAVLVAYATAHGSTAGVAERIAGRLRDGGFDVDLAEVGDRPDPSTAEAVVLGSAVHNGRWLPEASRYVDRHTEDLATRPAWLFSVCSIGDEGSFFGPRTGRWLARRRAESKELAAFQSTIRPVDHRYFAGAIQPDHWSRLGNLALRLVGGRFGDHRNWDDIDAWAESIAVTLARPKG